MRNDFSNLDDQFHSICYFSIRLSRSYVSIIASFFSGRPCSPPTSRSHAASRNYSQLHRSRQSRSAHHHRERHSVGHYDRIHRNQSLHKNSHRSKIILRWYDRFFVCSRCYRIIWVSGVGQVVFIPHSTMVLTNILSQRSKEDHWGDTNGTYMSANFLETTWSLLVI